MCNEIDGWANKPSRKLRFLRSPQDISAQVKVIVCSIKHTMTQGQDVAPQIHKYKTFILMFFCIVQLLDSSGPVGEEDFDMINQYSACYYL